MSRTRARGKNPRPSERGRKSPKSSAESVAPDKASRGNAKDRSGLLGWPTPVLLFAAALVIRILFTTATPDGAWPYNVAFKGDAPLWLDYAAALHRGQAFELGLPLHPPGTAYLIDWLSGGDVSRIRFLRFVWCFAGALTVVAVWAAVARSFGPKVALVAGAFSAGSAGLMVLSSSLNGETPYLLLVIASFVLLEDLRRGTHPLRTAAFAGLNALACLFRVEHVLAFLLVSTWACLAWRRQQGIQRAALNLGVLGAAFVLPLLPWHAYAWRAISRFNSVAPSLDSRDAAALGAVEARLHGLAWDEGARKERDRLPAFARRTAGDFVAATVLYRGHSRVAVEDFQVLKEAFGSAPASLSCCPFVSAYGPLNFALANHPAAAGGFSRAALEDVPPLVFSPQRYPPDLVRGLPPPDLSLVYPPHTRLVNDGYRVGWGWIAERPARYLRLTWRKLTLFWSGACLGFGGYDIPLGASGVRRAVDMVTPEAGWLPSLWQIGILVLTIFGVARAWGHDAFAPWLLYLISKVAITALFFGYARHGACVIPVIGLCVGLLAESWLLPSRRLGRALPSLVVGLLLLLLAAEGVRWLRPPAPSVDGRRVEALDPFRDEHRDQRVEWVPASGLR